jgi:hypothetical protein
MPDDTPIYNEDGTPFTLAQAREMMREVHQELNAAAAPVAPPAPAAPPPPADPRQAERNANIAALAAADAARERKRNLAASARLAFEEREGFSIDSHSDDEVLALMGVSDKPLTAAEERARTKREQEHEILTNPAAAAAYEHQRALTRFEQQYWTLARHQREAQAAAHGIDLATFTPPSRIWG